MDVKEFIQDKAAERGWSENTTIDVLCHFIESEKDWLADSIVGFVDDLADNPDRQDDEDADEDADDVDDFTGHGAWGPI